MMLYQHLTVSTSRWMQQIHKRNLLRHTEGDERRQACTAFPFKHMRAHHPSRIALQGAIFIPNCVLAWYEYDRQRTDRNTHIIIQHNVVIFVHVIINIIIINIIMIIINGFCPSDGDVMWRLYGDEGKLGHLLLLYPLVHLISELDYRREINMTVERSHTRSTTCPPSFNFVFSHS